MANIRVDVNYMINDGSEIVFRSPADCSTITGLIVYYPGEDGDITSKEFALADAHGENVGDIDHLFSEGVVVKVILDVTAEMAYVQNADTNAYIERTFVKTVNDVAPDENGNVLITAAGGEPGKSAYKYAQDGGYTGTEEEFSIKLATEYRPATWTPTASDVGAAATSHNHAASNITSGVLPYARGGIGKALSSVPKYAIMRNAGDGDYMWYLATGNGALYATAANGTPQFGTLPVKQGGTGATSEAAARKALGTNMTLLWTNGSPTSTFAAQSVDISGANYDCYMVVAHASKNTDVLTFLPMTIAYKGKEGHLIALPNNKIGRRVFSVNSAGTSVTFSATEYCKTTYGTAVTENDYIIPMYIYGMYLTTT